MLYTSLTLGSLYPNSAILLFWEAVARTAALSSWERGSSSMLY